jgi:hypothetical protein
MISYPRLKTKSGCLTCRRRRKKCDESKPTCIGCKRNGLNCTWPMEVNHDKKIAVRTNSDPKAFTAQDNSIGGIAHVISTHDTRRRPLRPIFSNTIASHPFEIIPGIRNTSDKYLFDHYMGVTATQAAGRMASRNPFITEMIPVAYQDPRVAQCLLALSGAHLRGYKSSQFEKDARSHYAATLRNVKHGLLNWQSSNSTDLMGILTMILFLCLFEVGRFI